MYQIKLDEHFDIGEILTCGQAFRYRSIEDGGYEVIANGQRLRVWQDKDLVSFSCDEVTYESLWYSYFDMGSDYGEMKTIIQTSDSRLEDYINKKPGIRILRQDPFEMVITFILSQNKSMPQIMQLVARLSETYGSLCEDVYGSYYAFPTPDQLGGVTEEAFRGLKVGFRAPYLVDAIQKVLSKQVDLQDLTSLPTEEAREVLMQVKGIGRKVADCILLFGYHRMDVFPLDVWMKRAMTKLYFDEGKASDKEMLTKAEAVFGDLAGLAQQYIFFGTVDGD